MGPMFKDQIPPDSFKNFETEILLCSYHTVDMSKSMSEKILSLIVEVIDGCEQRYYYNVRHTSTNTLHDNSKSNIIYKGYDREMAIKHYNEISF
jgi:hypothetical protein